MSGHLRSCFAAFVFLAGLSTSPASSNPFDFLFKAAPDDAAAPTPARAEATPARAETTPARAEDECLPHPGKSTNDGQYWVYRLDGHRKCWHQVDREVAAKKMFHHRAAKRIVAAPEEDEAAPPKRKQVVDARAELQRSAPAETPQPTQPAPELNVVDAAAVPVTAAAALVPPAPVVAKPATDQVTPHQPAPPQVDVDTLLAAAPAASDAVAVSVHPSTPAAIPIAKADDDWQGWTPTWLGVLLMGLGLVSLLISSWTLRGTFAFDGQPSALALNALATYRAIHATYLSHRDTIRKELADGRAQIASRPEPAWNNFRRSDVENQHEEASFAVLPKSRVA